MPALLAALPILLFATLLLAARWSAAAAGLAGAALAAVLAVSGPGLGEGGLATGLLGSLAEAAFSTATILWIVFAALCLHEYQTGRGALGVLGEWLASLGRDRRLAALFVAWFFALFLEGAAGFGTPIAMAAPLLVGLGFTPLRALTLVLVGHAVGVSFGAIGTPMVPLLAAGGHEARQLSLAIALMHGALAGGLVAWLFHQAGAGSARTPGPGHGVLWVVAAALLFLAPFVALAGLAGPELPTLGGALAGALAFAAFVRWRQHGEAGAGESGPGAPALFAATLPYLAIIGLVLLTRGVPFVREALVGANLDWRLAGGFGGSVALAYHPGTLLLLGLVLAGLPRPAGRAEILPAVRRALARLPRVALALLPVLLMARLMVHSGAIAQLADSAAHGLGPAWLLAAPAVGALGSFITGSATASNILFADFQQATALTAGLPPLLTAAGQGFGSAIGNIISPHNIVVGAAAVGLVGAEGQVLRRTLPVCLAYVAAGGLLLWVYNAIA